MVRIRVGEATDVELRERVVGIICERWERVEEGSEPDDYLEVSEIHERLRREGVEAPADALSRVLVELAKGDGITLTIDGRGATVYRNPRSKLCEDRAGE